jgi:hypothetical protein
MTDSKGGTMRKILVLLTIVLISVSASNRANAQIHAGEDAAMQAAIDVRNDFIRALEKKDFTEFAGKGMDGAIRVFADQIRTQYRDEASASELIRKWESTLILFQRRVLPKIEELGDHAPMFPWINEFLAKMSSRYGTIIYNLPIVKDIQMVNYALPVVFHPHGAWQQDGASHGIDLRIEYRKHFIPFANLVTYYTVLVGCNYVAQQQGDPELKRICKPAAEKLKFAMGRYVAPVVSDWIYNASSESLQIGPDRLRYNSAEDLRKAVLGR